jgi:lipoate-protein ligase A
MAVDEALLEAVAARRSPPTLRFYTWSSPWLSIGCAQRFLDDVDVALARQRGVGRLRRASGGTAVLHDDQLGFALVLPDDHPLVPADVIASYRYLGEPVAAALAGLGAPARTVSVAEARAPTDPIGRPACFGSLAPHETILEPASGPARKLSGHGQIRRRGVVLHHVVMSRQFDAGALADLLHTPDRPGLEAFLRTRVGSLADAGLDRSLDAVVDAIADSLATAGHATLRVGTLTDAESARAVELELAKYADQGWLARL